MGKKDFLQISVFIFAFILPLTLAATPISIEKDEDSNLFESVECVTESENSELGFMHQNSKEKYTDYHLEVRYYYDEEELVGTCKVTLKGTIETDIGTVEFDMEIEVSLGDGQDCADFAIRLLRSFQE